MERKIIEYNELVSIIESKGLKVNYAANESGYSESGLRKAVRNKTLRPEAAYKLSEMLDVDLNKIMVMDEDPFYRKSKFREDEDILYSKLSQALDILETQVKQKDMQIDRLLKIIENNQSNKK